jgi:hypothetical protein
MADKKRVVEVDINTNADEAGQKFVTLQTRIRETKLELQKAAEAGDKVRFNQLKGDLDDLESQLEKTQLQSRKFGDALASVPGPAGLVGQAIKGLDSAFKFLVANPIVAIIAGLAAVLYSVKEAMERTEGGTKALSQVTEAFGNIITPIIEFISAIAVPVVNLFADAVNGLAIALGLVNEEQVEAQEQYRQYAIDIKKANAELQGQINILEAKGNKEADIAGRSKQIINNEIDLLEQKRAAFGKLTAEEEAQIVALQNKKEVIDAKERTRLAKVAADAIKAKEELNAKLDEIDIANIEKQDVRDVSARQAKYAKDLRDLERDVEFIKLSEERKAFYRKQLQEAADMDIAKINKDARLKEYDDELKDLVLQQQGLAKNSQSFFENQREILRVSYEKEIFDAQDNADKKIEIDKKYLQAKKDLRAQEIAGYGAIASATISSFAAVTSALASGYDEEAKTSKDAFEKRKKLQKATAIMSAASGIIQILTQPSTIPSPFDVIVKVANAAAVAIATGIQIKNIDKAKFEGGGGSSASSSSTPTTATPAFNGTVNVPAPQIGASQATQSGALGMTIAGAVQSGNSTSRPIQAYVVGDQVSTQQQLDRRISVAAKMAG